MAMSYRGSRELQSLLDKPRIRYEIFGNLLNHIFLLMADRYGHHVVLKMITICNVQHLNNMVHKLVSETEFLIEACTIKYGKFCLQKLIKDHGSSNVIVLITDVVSQHIYTLLTSLEGKFLIEHCFHLDPTKTELCSSIAALLEVAKHKYGCMYLRDCISLITGTRRTLLLEKLSENCMDLSRDHAGSCFLKYVMDLQDPEMTTIIFCHLRKNYTELVNFFNLQQTILGALLFKQPSN